MSGQVRLGCSYILHSQGQRDYMAGSSFPGTFMHDAYEVYQVIFI